MDDNQLTPEQEYEKLINELGSICLISGWRQHSIKTDRVDEIKNRLSELLVKPTD